MRKWRLFAAACCRRARAWFVHPCQHALLDVAEAFADGSATADQLEKARASDLTSDRMILAAEHDIPPEIVVAHPRDGEDTGRLRDEAALKAAAAAAEALRAASQAEWAWGSGASCPRAVEEVVGHVRSCASASSGWREAASAEEGRALADIFRDVFGNPFRRVRFRPAWRSPAALAVAGAINAGRTFGDMPVLADALEEAGCEDAQVVGHCRGAGPHARGCWVIDLVLGKK